MANVLFKRGNTATINGTAIADGQLLYNTTTGQQYIDNGSTRKEVGKPVDTALSTTSTNAIANNAITTSIVNTTAEVNAITADNIPCGTKPVKELIQSLNAIVNADYVLLAQNTGSNIAVFDSTQYKEFDVYVTLDAYTGYGFSFHVVKAALATDNSYRGFLHGSTADGVTTNFQQCHMKINRTGAYCNSYYIGTGNATTRARISVYGR